MKLWVLGLCLLPIKGNINGNDLCLLPIKNNTISLDQKDVNFSYQQECKAKGQTRCYFFRDPLTTLYSIFILCQTEETDSTSECQYNPKAKFYFQYHLNQKSNKKALNQ